MATNTRVKAVLKTPPAEASIQNYFHDQDVLWGLKIWLAMTARTVHKIARYAIVDSTAFADTFVEVWRESEHGRIRVRSTSRWLKAHVLCDAATNMIGALIPTANRGRSADVKWLKALISMSMRAGWRCDAILGDKAYFDQTVRNWCEKFKMMLFVPLKDGTSETTRIAWDKHNRVLSAPVIFDRLMRYRSKIESCFSAWKRMFGPSAFGRVTLRHPKRRSGLSISQEIELYAKAVAYNLRRIATLEELLDQTISFAQGHFFEPMPEAWVSPESTPSLLTRPDLLDDAA